MTTEPRGNRPMISRKAFTFGLGALPLTARAASAQTAPPIEVGVSPTDSSALSIYAYDLGLFKDAGLDVHIDIVGNMGNVIPGAISGAYNIATANLGNIAVAKDHGIALHLVASGGVYSATSPTALLLVPADSPAK